MYQPQLEFSELIAGMNNLNLRQPLLVPPVLFVHPLVAMQQHLGMQVDTGFYGFPYCAVPVHWGITQQQQAPTPGPSRYQRSRGFHKAEPQNHYKSSHESYRTIARDHSTSINSGMARIDASNNSRAGKVWRTPPRKPIDG